MEPEPVRLALRAVPFVPFTLRMANDRVYHVDHPELAFVTTSGRTLVLEAPRERRDPRRPDLGARSCATSGSEPETSEAGPDRLTWYTGPHRGERDPRPQDAKTRSLSPTGTDACNREAENEWHAGRGCAQR